MKLTVTTAAICLVASTAFAGDWSGAYGGAYYSTADGEDYNIGGPYSITDGSLYGGFAGYRHDMGSFVFGGEVALSAAVDVVEDCCATWKFNSFTDVKATAGYDFGSLLAYASFGYTMAEFETPTLYDFAGTNAGIGVDFMVTDQIFVGGEYIYRFLERTDNVVWTAEIESIQIRAGYRF